MIKISRSQMPDKPPVSLLPMGTYNAVVVSGKLKQSQNNPNCRFLSLRIDVTGPTHGGSVLWENFILEHEKETVKDSGLYKLGSLLDVFNMQDFSSETQFDEMCLDIKVIVKKQKDGSERNEISQFVKSSQTNIPNFGATQGTTPNFNDIQTFAPF
jgi:hypothetical protein